MAVLSPIKSGIRFSSMVGLAFVAQFLLNERVLGQSSVITAEPYICLGLAGDTKIVEHRGYLDTFVNTLLEKLVSLSHVHPEPIQIKRWSSKNASSLIPEECSHYIILKVKSGPEPGFEGETTQLRLEVGRFEQGQAKKILNFFGAGENSNLSIGLKEKGRPVNIFMEAENPSKTDPALGDEGAANFLKQWITVAFPEFKNEVKYGVECIQNMPSVTVDDLLRNSLYKGQILAPALKKALSMSSGGPLPWTPLQTPNLSLESPECDGRATEADLADVFIKGTLLRVASGEQAPTKASERVQISILFRDLAVQRSLKNIVSPMDSQTEFEQLMKKGVGRRSHEQTFADFCVDSPSWFRKGHGIESLAEELALYIQKKAVRPTELPSRRLRCGPG